VNIRLRVRDVWRRVKRRLGMEKPLCRTCRYNNPRDCRHRGRPWAVICEDYRRK